MKTVDQVITRFRRHYPGCDTGTALDLFQTAYKRLLDKAQFRMTDITLSAFVAGAREYDWAEVNLRVYGVTWYKSASNFWPLRPSSEDELRDRDPGWSQKQLGAPVNISATSGASPISVTTATQHGFATGDTVVIGGVTGNPVANNVWIVNSTGPTTFTLNGSSGGGSSTAGGTATKQSDLSGDPHAFYLAARPDASSAKVVLGFDSAPPTTTTGGFPRAVCHCEQLAVISGSTVIPFSLLDEMYFVYAMCEFWAYEEDVQKAGLWERKRSQEEAVQIEHLKKLIPMQETVLLPPAGVFSKAIR